MSFLINASPIRTSEFEPRRVKEEYLEIQRDPYKYLLTPFERANAYGPIPRLLFGSAIGGLWVVYHLRRNNELHRLFRLNFSGDLVMGIYARLIVGFLVGDRIGAWNFCNYRAIWNHKAADYEVRKIMRTWPDAKPHVWPHQKPNSYFWV